MSLSAAVGQLVGFASGIRLADGGHVRPFYRPSPAS
jgi:hypothetical protein